MTVSSDFSPREFFQLANEATTHAVELKIKLAKAGVVERGESEIDDNSADRLDVHTSSTSRP